MGEPKETAMVTLLERETFTLDELRQALRTEILADPAQVLPAAEKMLRDVKCNELYLEEGWGDGDITLYEVGHTLLEGYLISKRYVEGGDEER